METIRQSQFNPNNYKKLNLIRNHRDGTATYTYEDTCDRCNGLGVIISHVCNGKPVLVHPDDGICYKCLGTKVMTRRIRTVLDSVMDEQEAKYKAEAEEAASRWEQMRQETIQRHINEGYKKVDFKIAGWFFGEQQPVAFNHTDYYIIKRDTGKAVLISYIDNLEAEVSYEQWFPKKAIIKEA